jgi:hypothetical protein
MPVRVGCREARQALRGLKIVFPLSPSGLPDDFQPLLVTRLRTAAHRGGWVEPR